jgi:hypothetical protein
MTRHWDDLDNFSLAFPGVIFCVFIRVEESIDVGKYPTFSLSFDPKHDRRHN